MIEDQFDTWTWRCIRWDQNFLEFREECLSQSGYQTRGSERFSKSISSRLYSSSAHSDSSDLQNPSSHKIRICRSSHDDTLMKPGSDDAGITWWNRSRSRFSGIELTSESLLIVCWPHAWHFDYDIGYTQSMPSTRALLLVEHLGPLPRQRSQQTSCRKSPPIVLGLHMHATATSGNAMTALPPRRGGKWMTTCEGQIHIKLPILLGRSANFCGNDMLIITEFI